MRIKSVILKLCVVLRLECRQSVSVLHAVPRGVVGAKPIADVPFIIREGQWQLRSGSDQGALQMGFVLSLRRFL